MSTSGYGLSQFESAYNPLSSGGSQRAQRIKLGALSFAYILHHVTAFTLCVANSVYIAGLSKMLFNYPNAFETWTYWRFWGLALFSTPLAFLTMYCVYQERKVAAMTAMRAAAKGEQSFSTTLDRTLARIVYAFVAFVFLLVGAYYVVTQTWDSIDAGQCTTQQCQGPNFKTTPTLGMWLVLIGGWAVIVLMIALFLLLLYIHAAARDLWAVNMSMSTGYLATLAAAIGNPIMNGLNHMGAAINDGLGLPVHAEVVASVPWEALEAHLDTMPAGSEPVHVGAAIFDVAIQQARDGPRTAPIASSRSHARRAPAPPPVIDDIDMGNF
jgi:hypothetical protein